VWAGDRGDPHGATAHSGLLRIDARTVMRAVDEQLATTRVSRVA
jgi:hypothetical protein